MKTTQWTLLLLATLVPACGGGGAGGSSSSPQQVAPLRELAAQRGILIGALDGHAHFAQDANPLHEGTFDREFAVTSTYVDISVLHPAQNTYWYEAYLDGTVDRNEAAGAQLLLTPLVYHDFALPGWILSNESNWTRDSLSAVLREWIQTTVGRYAGRVHAWVVVNEPLSYDSNGLQDNIWLRVIGPDYIDLAFQWAREADPAARLFLNDTNIETSDWNDPVNSWMATRAEQFRSLVAGMVQRGVPVDGVGFQMHTNLSSSGPHAQPRVPAGLAVELQFYSDLGLGIAITEWDVAIDNAPGTLEERLQQQAQVYGETMAVLVAQPAVEIIHLWGVSDSSAEYQSFAGVPPEVGQPVLFDVNYEPKPAYFAVRDALSGP